MKLQLYGFSAWALSANKPNISLSIWTKNRAKTEWMWKLEKYGSKWMILLIWNCWCVNKQLFSSLKSWWLFIVSAVLKWTKKHLSKQCSPSVTGRVDVGIWVRKWNDSQSYLASWTRSLPLCPKGKIPNYILFAFTAGGVGISGVCPVAAPMPAQNPGQKLAQEEGCLWCWAPVRSKQ